MRWCCGASIEPPAEPLTAEQLAEKKDEAEPPLTVEQLAEKKKKEEAELIAAQLAKPSYWDEVGPSKPNASALKAALADTVLVDAAWLARLADEGGILPRCQDLPPGVRVTLKEMEKWTDYGQTLGVLVISYPWLDADHPDKDGLQLRKIAKVLKIFDKEAKKYGAGCKVGVFLDYVSMPQRSRGSPVDDRTPEELATFKRSLQGINLWYANEKTFVLLVDTDLPEGAHTNMHPYAGRGWCVMERKASGLVKYFKALISLKDLRGNETCLYDVRMRSRKAMREPPMAPAAFKSMLEAGVASGAIKFTNRGDVGVVATIYGKAFAAEMAAVVNICLPAMKWDDAQVLTVFEAFRAAHAGGGLRKVKQLDLNGSRMRDGAAAALVALLEEGAMPNLEWLDLSFNQISNDGVAALASALRGGALPSCTKIILFMNPGSDATIPNDVDSKVKEALASPERAAALARCRDELSA